MPTFTQDQKETIGMGVPSPNSPPPEYSPAHLSTTGLGINPGSGPSPGAGTIYPEWAGHDPRTSSAQSLAPSVDSQRGQRRKLLMIFIHGFMGNDTSFRSFPAHLHAYLRMALIESHVIHSKIYPRYKTYKSIDLARDNFSKWLEPHEGSDVDVVLVGHSMGGLLSAEIVMMPNANGHGLKHRILGTLNLDVPFVGLHPGIVVAGISSLFRKADPPKDVDDADLASLLSADNASGSLSPDPSTASMDFSPLAATTSPTASVSTTATSPMSRMDPNFNAPFFNDVLFKDRGWWRNIAHFAAKHKPEGLVHAARDHILSHLEFPAVLVDHVKLNQRYNKLRRLEDVDDITGTSGGNGAPMLPPREARVRFANFYTLSTGIPKKRSPSPSGSEKERRESGAASEGEGGLARQGTVHLKPEASSAPGSARESLDRTRRSGSRTRSPSPRISIEDHSDSSNVEVLQMIEPEPMQDESEDEFEDAETGEKKEPPPYSEADPARVGKGSGATSGQQGQIRQSIEHDTDTGPPSRAAPAIPATVEIPPTPASAEAPPEDTLPLDTTSTSASTLQPEPTPASPAPSASISALPPIADPPPPPETPDFTQYTDPSARKQAEREHKRALKSHADTIKNHERALKERAKLIEKATKTASKQQSDEEKRLKKEAERMKKEEERMAKEAAKLKSREEKEREKEKAKAEKEREKTEEVRRQQRRDEEGRVATMDLTAEEQMSRLNLDTSAASAEAARVEKENKKKQKEAEKANKPPKLRKFCTLPRGVAPNEDGSASVGDRTWIPVRMEGMDEVGAHCGLFFAGPHYERLVGETGMLVVSWVGHDATRRAVWEGAADLD